MMHTQCSVLVGLSLSVLAVCGATEARGQPAAASSEREEILRLNRELSDAFARRDAGTLNRLLAPDYTIVSPRGRLMTRDVYVGNRVGAGAMVEAGATFDQVSVRLYGTTAVVTSHFTTEIAAVRSLTLQERQMEFRVLDPSACNQRNVGNTRTDTWIKRNGRWQLVATQLSPVGFTGASDASARPMLCGLNAGDLLWTDSSDFPGARIAVLSGNAYNGPYVIRMQRPNGHVEQPHRHESDETVSVLSGTLHIGLGNETDRDSAKTFGAGAYVIIPARTVHYSWTEGAIVEDLAWNGPASPVFSSERREIALASEALPAYVGTYRFTNGATITITLNGAQLMGQLQGAPAQFPIFPESATKFFLKSAPPGASIGVNAQIEFVKGSTGAVTDLIFRGGQGERKATRVSKP